MENQGYPGVEETSKQLKAHSHTDLKDLQEKIARNIQIRDNYYRGPLRDKLKVLATNQIKFQNSLAKLHKRLHHIQNLNAPAYRLSSLIQERTFFEHAIKNLSTIHDFPRFILTLDEFASYSCCQILIHQKGQSQVVSFLYDQHRSFRSSIKNIKDFTALLNHVKKSKLKFYDQTTLQSKCVEAMGPFLSKGFKFKGHNLIVILSRNGFLRPEKEEEKIFYSFMNLIHPIFTILLQKDQLDQAGRHLLWGLRYFPYPLLIQSTKNHSLVYKNLASLKKMKIQNSQMYKSHIDDEHYLTTFQNPLNPIVSNVYHAMRISLLGELLNTLQHELSNPLLGIKLCAELITENAPQDAKELIDSIESNASRCQGIINNFSHLYSNEEKYESCNLKKLVEEAFTLSKSETIGIAVEVIGPLPESDKEVFVTTNPTWITQIIFNLIINAGQAINSLSDINSRKKITATIFAESVNQEVIISISDSGPGINPEHIPGLFQPFYTTKEKGHGLGLSICKNLAKKLGGRLHFYNNDPLPGATFNLRIPRLFQPRGRY